MAIYADGHAHCFGIGCGYHTAAVGADNPNHRRPKLSAKFIEGEFRALPKRCLTAETCRKFGIRLGKLDEDVVLALDYKDQDGTVVAQKVRKEPKSFTVLGDAKRMGLFGQHLWPNKGRRVVVTEGELDAAALCQADGLKWPTVSIPNGSSGARKALAGAREWLEGFDEVVLAFDADDAGRAAVADAAGVLTPGKVKIADFSGFGFKDANEAIIRAETEHDPQMIRSLLKAIWDARVWRPDGVVSLSDIRARVTTPIEVGRPWPWAALTKATFGRRIGDVIGFGGPTGGGKTDLFTQTIAHDVDQGVRCGVLALEQDVGDTGRRIAGKRAKKRFHVPDGSWTQAELEAAWADLEATDRVKLFDNFGAMDWETIKARIQFMIEVEGCEHIFLDHLTALAAAEEDERKALEKIMAEAAMLAKGRCVLHYISHLATPEGKPHEEGGRIMVRHFKGSRAIGFWSHFMFGLERNQQADDPTERMVTTIRCLKDRHTGQATGQTFEMIYNPETGLLEERTGFEGDQVEEAAVEAGF